MFGKRRWLFVALALMATLSLVLVSCAGNANNNFDNGTGLEEPVPPEEATPTPDLDDDPLVEPEEEATPTPEPTPTLETTPEGEAALPDETDDVDVGGLGRPWALSSRIIGWRIENEAGDEIADIDEVLFDENGEIHYVIFDVDDYLDLDEDRTVAVEFDMLDFRLPEAWAAAMDETDDDTLDDTDVVTVTRAVVVYTGGDESLRQASEIDTDVLDDADLVVDAAQLNLDGNLGRLFRLSYLDNTDLLGTYNVVNENDENVGDANDMILNLEEGVVSHIIVGVGGFLGIGEKNVAIPWDMVTYDEAEDNLVIPLTEEELEAAPEVDLGEIRSDGFYQGWNEENDTYWDETLPETGVATVQEPTEDEEPTEDQELTEDPDPAMADSPQWVLARDLVNQPVQLEDGQTVSDVDNMLFDTDGQIRYVILEVGDDLDDVDTRTVAVAYDRFRAAYEIEENDVDNDNDIDTTDTITPTDTVTPTGRTVDRGTPVLIYLGTHEELAAEPEIDRDLLDDRDVITDTAALGVDAPDAGLMQVDEFNYRILNQEGDRIGSVDDLILNLQEGTVAYIVVGRGGFLGIGRDYVPVPWEMVEYDQAERRLIIGVTAADEEYLRDAPTVNLRAVSNDGFTPGWNEQVDVYWEDTLPVTGLDPAEAHRWVLTSELIGSWVQTQDGEEIAEIENILFTVDGELRYVVFNVADYLEDVDDRLVAVEWNMFEVTTPTMRTGDPAVDDGTAADPQTDPGAPGTTPRTDDGRTATPVLVYTGTVGELTQEPEIDADVLGERTVITDTAALGLDTAVDDRLLQADDLSYDIVNREGDDIGRVYDLVLDQQENRISYLVVGVGGFLGIGRNYVAVPWDMVSYDEAEDALVLPISAEDDDAFDEAPTINLRGFRNEGFSLGWNRPTDRYWQNFGTAEPM
jgi:sporulation protein YlmC with PRC-barrel domain